MNSGYACEWHIKSDPTLVPPLVRELLDRLRMAVSDVSHEECGDIRLILSELLYNAVIHGNGANERKFVHINLTISQRELRVSVLDEGSGFDMKKACMESTGDKESGRGLQLVTKLADEVRCALNGRQITFVKKIGVRHG